MAESEDKTPEQLNRTAVDYAAAVAAIELIAGLMVKIAPHPGVKAAAQTVASAAPKLREFAAAAPALAAVAVPVVDKVMEVAPDAASNAVHTIGKTGSIVVHKVGETGGSVAHKVGAVGGAAVHVAAEAAGKAGVVAGAAAGVVAERAKAAMPENIKEAAEERKDEKARKEARRGVVEAAESMTMSDFLVRREAYIVHDGENELRFLSRPGCYVILTLGKGKHDLAAYRDVYVGASTDMGAALEDEAAGKGNVDVYADFKYDQDVYVLPYFCDEDKIEDLKASLIAALDADVSYNA